jgi:hypothetical protein
MGRVAVGVAAVVIGVLATLLVDGDADASIDPPAADVRTELTAGELATRTIWRSDAEIEPYAGERW